MSNNVTARTTTSAYFTYDHINKRIVGTDINFSKAGIDDSVQYKALMAAMARHPDYSLFPITTPKKEKQTYKGLTLPLMESYLAIYEGELADEARSKFAEMKAKHKNKELAFGPIKSWFLDLFPGFNVEKAKREIQAKKLVAIKAPYKVMRVSVGVPHHVNK